MRFILSTTLPIYLLIAVGWLAVRSGLFAKAEMRVLGRFVVGFCLPALVFHALSQRSFDQVLQPSYLLAYAVAALAMQFGGLMYARRVKGLPLTEAAVRSLGMSGSNSGFMGLPIVTQLVGPIAGVALAMNMLIENLVTIPLALALADSGDQQRSRMWPTVAMSLRGLLRNPLIVAILAGLVCSLIGLQLPEPVARTVQLVSTASSPLALFLIGGTLVGLQVRGLLRQVLEVVFAKLVIMPLLILGLILLLPPMPAPLRVAAIVMAAMPMLSVYPVLAQKYHQEDFCAAALLAATVCSFLTISAWIWGLGEWTDWLP